MKRSIVVLLTLLLFSCTCFSYNSLIFRRVAEKANPNEGTATAFALGYPFALREPGAQSTFTGGYPASSGHSDTDEPFAGGYVPATSVSGTERPFAVGYPVPLTNPSAQKAVALGYPAPCSAGQVNIAQKDIISGIVAYTIYDGTAERNNTIPNVKRIAYRYDGSKFTLGVAVPIATTLGADGITALPNGNLVVGSEGHEVYLVSPQAGPIKIAQIAGTVESDHVTYDSQRNVIWTSGYSSSGSGEGLAEIPLPTFAGAIIRQVKGDDVHVTHIAFDTAHKAYYTNSQPQGHGSFGVVDLDTFTTTRKINNIPAAHGISFDHFTNTLFLVGSNHITQIDPITFAIISDWVAPPEHSQFELDQAAFDGRGHLWATSNDGNIVFIDFSRTRKIADPANYQSIQFIDTKLDDVTLLCTS